MKLGWKILIPAALVWTLFVAAARATLNTGHRTDFFLGIAAAVVVVLAISFGYDAAAGRRERAEEAEAERQASEPFDPFAGGYPVPPMPGQRLPDLAPATVTAESPASTPQGEDTRD